MNRRAPIEENRTERARKFLCRNKGQAFKAREVSREVDPGGSVDVMAATLSGMASRGEILKVGKGFGNVHFCAIEGVTDARRTQAKRARAGGGRKATPAPATPVARRAYAGTAEQRQLGARLKPLADRISGAARPSAAARRRAAAANFSAPLETVANPLDPKQLLRARIAADIAAFEQSGGHVERLGVTRLFHDLSDLDDQD